MAIYTLTDVGSIILDDSLLVSSFSTIVYAPDETPTRWSASPVASLNYFPEGGGGGGGSTRPTSGMLYPRGQC